MSSCKTFLILSRSFKKFLELSKSNRMWREFLCFFSSFLLLVRDLLRLCDALRFLSARSKRVLLEILSSFRLRVWRVCHCKFGCWQVWLEFIRKWSLGSFWKFWKFLEVFGDQSEELFVSFGRIEQQQWLSGLSVWFSCICVCGWVVGFWSVMSWIIPLIVGIHKHITTIKNVWCVRFITKTSPMTRR